MSAGEQLFYRGYLQGIRQRLREEALYLHRCGLTLDVIRENAGFSEADIEAMLQGASRKPSASLYGEVPTPVDSSQPA